MDTFWFIEYTSIYILQQTQEENIHFHGQAHFLKM